MSLHIGNLSFRTRKEELEHEFRRFGQCSVRIKDGYGFVVYDFPPNAERALKALEGRNICGQPLTLTWSKKQPKAFKRYAGADRSHERVHGLNSFRGRDSYADREWGSHGREDYKVDAKHPETNRGRQNSFVDNIVDEETGYSRENVAHISGDERSENMEDHVDVTYRCDYEPFERYKPDQGYDKMDEAENHSRMAISGGSSARQSSRGKTVIEHAEEVTFTRPYDNSRSRKTCYSCGGLGHKMRNCPKGNALKRKSTGLDHRHENDAGGWDKIDSRSQEIQSPSKYSETTRLERDKRTCDSGKLESRMQSGSSRVDKDGHDAWEKGSGRRKRSDKETRSPKGQIAKKARSSGSRLKSLSLKSGSLSSASESLYTSHHSRSRSSSPTSLSLSASLDMSLPSSPNKTQLNQKEVLNKSPLPEPAEIQGENGRSMEDEGKFGEDKLRSQTLNMDDVVAFSSDEAEGKTETVELLHADNNRNDELSKLSQEATTRKNQDSDASLKEMMPAATEKAKLEAASSPISRRMTNISSDELNMVLKHYGLELQKETKRHNTSIETYFGSARFWPWDIIYYRRLKKGPISVENYERRLAQNKEFGIVDKYIRSSSGWGEEPVHIDC